MSIDSRLRGPIVQAVPAAPHVRALPIGLTLPLTAVVSVLVGVLSLGVAPHGSLVGAVIVDDPAGWALVGIVLVMLSGQRRTVPCAILGLVAFTGLDLGWYFVGGGALSASAVFWYAVAVLAGPLVGIATGWSRSTAGRAAIGGGSLAGLLIGDATVSLRLLGNVPEAAGLAIAALGAGLLLLSVVRCRNARTRLVAIVSSLAVASLYTAAWAAIMLVL